MLFKNVEEEMDFLKMTARMMELDSSVINTGLTIVGLVNQPNTFEVSSKV